jgi:hypothetical protein
MTGFRTFGGAALTLAAPLALAHHSPAAYDRAAQITIVGMVTHFEWANPHAYVTVKEGTPTGSERLWLVELVSPSSLRQFGWSATTLAAGDQVSLTANPGRDRERNIASLTSVEKAGTVLLDIRNIFPPKGAEPKSASAFSAKSLAGTWASMPGPVIGQFTDGAAALPTTPKGAAAIRDFRDTVNPGRDCVPFPAPFYMIFPIFRSITVGDDAVVIRSEEGDVDRTVHMNRTSHDGATVSVQGDSIGRWEGDVLFVDTTHFAEHRLGNAAGLPSSAAKHLVERFQLTPGGGLSYTFTIEDAEYLTAAVTGMSSWAYRPDVTFAPIACNLDNARRFLSD